MITAQQARDISFKLQIKDTEYIAAVKWLEEHVEQRILKDAENKKDSLFIEVNEREIKPNTVIYALHSHGFTVTCAGGTLCEDNIHRIRYFRISWE